MPDGKPMRALMRRMNRSQASTALLALADAGLVVIDPRELPRDYRRPQDTTRFRSWLSCSGSRQPPVKGTTQHPTHLRMATGICSNPRCGRRLKLYANGLVARHKEGC